MSKTLRQSVADFEACEPRYNELYTKFMCAELSPEESAEMDALLKRMDNARSTETLRKIVEELHCSD